MTRMLVTGFPPFTGCPVNPTQQLVERVQTSGTPFSGVDVFAELLPVEYVAIESEVRRLLQECSPDLWLAFGVCQRRELFHLESVGRNLDDSNRPDNAGEIRQNHKIIPGGPEIIRTTLDLEALHNALSQAGFETRISDDAGTYLCNHLLYFAQHELLRTGNSCRFLFTHVAPPSAGFPPEKLWEGFLGIAGWFLNRQTSETELLASADPGNSRPDSGSVDHPV